MATSTVEQREGNNKKVGWLTTLVMHIALLMIILYPFLTIPNPPPGQEGILISFGTPDVGQGDVQPIADNSSESPAEETPVEQPEEEVEEVVPEEAAPPESSEPERDVLTADDAEAIAIQKEKDRKAREKAEKEAEEEAERLAEAEAKRKAEEEARRKAEEEARKKEEARNRFNVFNRNNNNSEGQGNTGTPGDQGAPNGDPNADNLNGDNSTGKGSSDVGGGLAGRGVDARPTVSNRSQKEGKVRIKICVDPSGKVTSAEYSLSGSRTQDSYLVKLAKDSAKKFKFSANPMAPESQCGHIDFNFVLN